MNLYTTELRTLRGYYQSDVYVVADTKEEALSKLLEAVRAYVLETTEAAAGYCCYTEAFADEPDWPSQFETFMENVHDEAHRCLELVPSNVIVAVTI